MFVLACAAVLAWSCRGALSGIPLADDFAFLERIRFSRPLDFFDSMGAAYYWRPISRQLYFLLMSPLLLSQPRWAAAIHVGLLLILAALVFRIARHRFSPAVAAALAAFPLVAEPTRALIVWPSGGQHLLTALFAALAVERALAGRRVQAALAALAGVLCGEVAVLLLPALPALEWSRTRSRAAALRSGIAAALVLGVWGAGYTVARAHGVAWPSGSGANGLPWAGVAAVIGRALAAQLNLEDTPVRATWFLVAAYALLLGTTLVLALRRRRDFPVATLPAAAGGLLWFGLGSLPLLLLLPDWNSWRTLVPSLGLGFALIGGLAMIDARLVAGLVAIRTAGLLLALPASTLVGTFPPATGSEFSFRRIVRLERVVESTRLALTARYPVLPRAAQLRHWLIPARTVIAFDSSWAVRLWYSDASASWSAFAGVDPEGSSPPPDALVQYNVPARSPAIVIEPEALRLWTLSLGAFDADQLDRADSLLVATQRAQKSAALPLYALIALTQARVAFERGQFARADSFNRLDFQYGGESAPVWAMEAQLALGRGDMGRAHYALSRSLDLDSHNAEAHYLARKIGWHPRER